MLTGARICDFSLPFNCKSINRITNPKVSQFPSKKIRPPNLPIVAVAVAVVVVVGADVVVAAVAVVVVAAVVVAAVVVAAVVVTVVMGTR